jgi:co-chaperonin GroES (HSP10)
METGKGYLVEDDEGRVVADIRDASELVGSIDLFSGWVVVQRMKLSEKTRGGIALPSDEAKQEHNLRLFRVVIAGPPKEVGVDKDTGKPTVRPVPFGVGDVVVLKPSLAQMLRNQGQEFGVVADTDVIGKMKLVKVEK